MDKQLTRDFAAGAAIALLYLPLSQLNEIIWMKQGGIPPAGYALLLSLYAAAACLVLYSRNVRTALGRMILSLPFTVLFQWVLYALHLLDRAVGWVYGGTPPQALDTARPLRMLTVFIAVWFGVLIGIFVTGRDLGARVRAILTRVHRIVLPALGILIFGSLLVLHIIMPSWDAVSRALQGSI